MLVLGASGFVGAAAADAASRAGWRVRGAGRQRPARCADAVEVDLADSGSLRNACEGVDVVVHSAGLAHVFGSAGRVADFDAVNVRGTAAVIAAAASAGVRRVVLISSVSVYGDGREGAGPEGLDETTACRPASAYARSKLAAEAAAREGAAAGIELVVLRLATVYGPGDPGNVARLMRTIDRRRFLWIGRGSNRKTLVHVDDLGRAIVAASSPGAPTGVYNLGAPAVSMAEVVAELALALGRPVPAVQVPQGLALAAAHLLSPMGGRSAGLASTLAKWVAEDVYDGRRFERDFRWQAQVSLQAGVRGEVAWYRAGGPRTEAWRPVAAGEARVR